MSMVNEVQQRLGERLGIVYRHDQRIVIRFEQFPRAGLAIGGHDRQAKGHRFYQHQAKALIARTEAENRCVLIGRGDIRKGAGKCDTFS